MAASSDDHPFKAIFEGNKHTISNLYMNYVPMSRGTHSVFVGLFGKLGWDDNGTPFNSIDDQRGEIRNLDLIDGSVTSTQGNIYGAAVGFLVGFNDRGIISGCSATGDVKGYTSVGGLVGRNYGTLISCYATGDVTGTYAGSIGGLVGSHRDGTLISCYATGVVTGIPGSYVGGLVGLSLGAITSCYATGKAKAGVQGYVGGLVGTNGSYPLNTTSDSMITSCYATGEVSGEGACRIGGLAGHNQGKILASYATGNASGKLIANEVGGLVGRNQEGTIRACYATGSVSGEGSAPHISYVGGLVGKERGSGSIIMTSYFNNETSTVTPGIGTTDQDDPSYTSYTMSKTTGQLQYPMAYDGVDAAFGGEMIYLGWNIDIDNADGDDDLMTGKDDPWNFGTTSEYPMLKAFGASSPSPSFSPDPYTFPVPENAATATEVGTVSTDPAIAGLTYSLSGPGHSNFSIDNDGAITVSADAMLDYESTTSYTIVVRARTALGKSNTKSVRISVTDVNEAPTFGDGSPVTSIPTLSVSEDAAQGTEVGTFQATDPDSDALTYSLSGPGHNNFSINNNGVITVSAEASLDYETTSFYAIILKASDGNLEAMQFVIIKVNDVDEAPDPNPPVFGVAQREKLTFRVYPNPVSDRVHLSGLEATHSYGYKIYSLLGQQLLSGTFRGNEAIDLSALSPARYLLLLETEEGGFFPRQLLILR